MEKRFVTIHEVAAEIAEPPLTTIHVPKEEVGARCVEMLRATIETGERQPAVTVPVRLVARESSAESRSMKGEN